MLLQRSRLAAPPAERPRLAPPWMLGLLGAFVGSVLVLIYPHTDLLARVQNAPPDALTLRYMGNLLRIDPANHRLRLLLAAHELRHNHTADARVTLMPLTRAEDPALRNEAAWLIWQSLDADLTRLAADDPARHRLTQELRRRFRSLDIDALPDKQVARIIDAAFSLGEHDYAHELMRRAARNGSLTPEWYAGRAQAALGRGDYRLAADLFLLARARAGTIPERRRWYIRAIRTLQAGNRVRDALALADENIGELSEDRETLIFLANLARAAADPAAAERYARRLLRLALLESQRLAGFQPIRRVALPPATPDADGPGLAFDQQAYRLGYLIFMENGKLEDAYRVAQSAVRQRPRSQTWRQRLAQVAEWTQRPSAALEQWHWLARHTDHPDAWTHVRRLSAGHADIEAELLRRDAATGETGASLRLARSLENEGQTAEALAIIDRLIAQPQGTAERLELRRQRLALLDRMGRADDALAESARLIDTPDATFADRRRHAERLAALDRRAEALALLETLHANDPEAFNTADVALWRFYSELAGQLDRTDLAIRAAHGLSGLPDADAGDREAAYWTLRETAPAAAFELARENWLARRQTSDLQRALDLALIADRTTEGLILLDTLPPGVWTGLVDQPQLAASAARLMLKEKRRDAAVALLKDALDHSPDDKTLAELLLWTAIEIASETPVRIDAEPPGTERRELLARLLDAYELRWARQPALHDPLAVAWQILEQPERALRRYLRPQLATRYGDADWRQRYEQTLATLENETDRRRVGPTARLAGGRIASRQRGALDEAETGLAARLPLAASSFLQADLSRRRFRVSDAAQLGQIPAGDSEVELTLGLDAEAAGRQTHVTVIGHRGERNSTGWRIGHRQPLEAHLRLEAELARDERSVESLPLLLAGRQHRAQIALAFDATPRDTLILIHRRDTYRIEAGTELGAGQRWQLEAGHRILMGGAFDLSAAAFVARVQTTRHTRPLTDPDLVGLQAGNPPANVGVGTAFFVPDGFVLKGLRLSSGLEYRDSFTRTPRPYLNLARSWHSRYGPADETEIGLATSLLGHDHLRLGFTQGRTVSGGTDTFREVILSYRLHF